MKQFSKKQESLRKSHNKDLIRRMENGEPLSAFNSQASWFPPRKIIEKDRAAVKQLYGETIDPRLNKSETEQNDSPNSRPIRPA